MEQTVTTIEELLCHLEGVTTARELGRRMCVLGLQGARNMSLAKAAGTRLGVSAADGTWRNVLTHGDHTPARKRKQAEATRTNYHERGGQENRKSWYEERGGREYNASWKASNREWIAKRNAAWYVGPGRKWLAEWKKANPGYARDYQRARKARDPYFRLVSNLRVTLWHALRGRTKAAATLELVGCTVEEYRAYIERLFEPSMTWENWGEAWEIDHIKPLACFDLADPEAQRCAFHYSNTAPLAKTQNRTKGSLYEGVRHRHGCPR